MSKQLKEFEVLGGSAGLDIGFDGFEMLGGSAGFDVGSLSLYFGGFEVLGGFAGLGSADNGGFFNYDGSPIEW